MSQDRDEAVDRLRRLAARAPKLGADGAWLAERLRVYLTGAETSLDEALELLPAPGQRSWRWIENRHRRDMLIRRLAAMLPQALSRRAHAQVIADTLRRYEATAWIRDRRAGRPPAGPSAAAALKFAILSLGGNAPSLRAIQEILSDQ